MDHSARGGIALAALFSMCALVPGPASAELPARPPSEAGIVSASLTAGAALATSRGPAAARGEAAPDGADAPPAPPTAEELGIRLPRRSPLASFTLESLMFPPLEPVARPADERASKTLREAIEREVATDVWRSLARFYAERGYRPIWTSQRAAALRARLAEAHLDGLDPAHYSVPSFEGTLAGRARHEIALTEAAIRYARHAHSGRVAPESVSRIMTLEPPRLSERTFLSRLAHARDVAATLDSVHPQHAQYQRLKAALAKHFEGREDAPVLVGAGPNLKLGVSSERVALLRQRLAAPPPAGEDATAFDALLAAAVKAFQRENGLRADGIVGPRTLAALDGTPANASVEEIVANMERWRWMPRWLGAHHVFVNVPAFRVKVSSAGETTYSGRVIVGKSTNPTPIFSDEIEHVVVNPYWNVPFSIASTEMLGAIQRNPSGYFARRGYEVVSNGRVVSPSSIAWSRDTLRRVRIRQRPGRGNALGSVKFLFPNRYAVYLHDTPTKHLFSRARRAFSHGCVRVQDPFVFADALLAKEPDLSGPGLKRRVGGRQNWINVERKIPVHIAYFTLEVADDGGMVRHGDIYGFDARTQRALGL